MTDEQVEILHKDLCSINETLKQVLPKPQPEQPQILKDLDKVKKLVPDQYAVIVDITKFIVECIEDPGKVKKDKEKIDNFLKEVKAQLAKFKNKK